MIRMRSILKLIFLTALMGMHSIAFGGASEVDDQLWASATITKDVSSHFTLEIEQQFRYRDQYSIMNKSISQFSIVGEATDFFKVSVAYRYTNIEDAIARRWQLAGTSTLRKKKLRASHRLQYQSERSSESDTEEQLRNKLTLRYSLWSRIAPYIEYEWFHLMGEKELIWRKYRAAAGIRINVPGPHVVKLYLRKQQQVNRKSPDRQNIVGLKYEFDL